jgi:PAS domain S-box-containing protein
MATPLSEATSDVEKVGCPSSITVYSVELVAICALYFALSTSRALSPLPPEVFDWPPTGLAVALFLLRGPQVWPAVFLGSFSYLTCFHAPVWVAAIIAAGGLSGSLTGSWLLTRLAGGAESFRTPTGVVCFTLLCFVPTALFSSVSAAGMVALVKQVESEQIAFDWLQRWITDGAISLFLIPTVVFWSTQSLRGRTPITLLLTLTCATLGAIAYSPELGNLLSSLPDYILRDRAAAGSLVWIPLVWAAIRGDQRLAITGAAAFSAFQIYGLTTAGPVYSPLSLLFGAAAVTVPVLIISAAVHNGQETKAQLAAAGVRLAEELTKSKLLLERANHHFQTLIEDVPEYAIFVLDTSGRVASWNVAAQQMIGYAADEIIGQQFSIIYRPDERRAGEPIRALESAVQNGKAEVEGWRVRKDGTPFFVKGRISAISNSKGELVGFSSVIRDATEHRDTQEKLTEAREQLAMAQKMEAIGKLTGGIAHDFNNLLMIIGGNAQTFKRLLDPKLPKAIEAIQTAAKRGETLTRQLLTFSRRQHLSPTLVNLRSGIKNMRPLIESSLRGNIVFAEDISEDLFPVKVDLAELELAVVNLAVNARDAMPNGGTFTVTARNLMADEARKTEGEHGKAVEIKFIDTGTGIPPHLLTKIFDPFFTTKEVGKGTGLGLSQVYGFAHQADGTVKAESKIGRGTAITICLPACFERDVSVNPSAVQANASHPKVLVVDDSPDVAQVTSTLFEHLGYETLYRESAESALRLLDDGTSVSLVFSDIVMPGNLDGLGLANEIRSRFPKLPVILTTGYSDVAQSTGAEFPIIRKPFGTDALGDVVKAALGSSTSIH